MLSAVQLGFGVSLRRSLWGKGVVGLQVRPEGEGQQKGPQQAYRQQGSAFSFMVSPPLKTEKYRKGLKEPSDQIRRTERQQQYQRHRLRNGQHGAPAEVSKAAHRLGGQGVAPSKAMTKYDGVAGEVVKALSTPEAGRPPNQKGGDPLPGGRRSAAWKSTKLTASRGHIQVL